MEYFYHVLPSLSKLVSAYDGLELKVDIYDPDNIALSFWTLDPEDGCEEMVSLGYIDVTEDVDRFFEELKFQISYIVDNHYD